MELVAAHLYLEAAKQTTAAAQDQFGRTAFNRYYYATFLHTRACLSRLNSDWATLPHKDMPDVLKASVKKALNKGRLQAVKVQDADVANLCARAENAAIELSKILQEGYSLRKVADYRPEIPIVFLKGYDFALNSVEIKHAREWPCRAIGYVAIIVSAWKQIHD